MYIEAFAVAQRPVVLSAASSFPNEDMLVLSDNFGRFDTFGVIEGIMEIIAPAVSDGALDIKGNLRSVDSDVEAASQESLLFGRPGVCGRIGRTNMVVALLMLRKLMGTNTR